MNDSREARQDAPARRGSGISGRQIVLGILIVLILWFVITNGQKVEVDYIVGSSNWPLWLVIVVCVGLGMLLDRAIQMAGRRRERRERRERR